VQHCPHCNQALDEGLLPICWHCGRAIQLETGSPAPAPAKPQASGEDTSHGPTSLDLAQLVEQLDLEPDFVSAPPVTTTPVTTTPETPPLMPPVIAPPQAIAPQPVATSARHSAKPPAFAPQVALAAMAAQLRERVPDWRRHKLPILGVAGLGVAVLALSVMGRPNAETEVASTPAPAPAAATPRSSTPTAVSTPVSATTPGPATPGPATPSPAAPSPPKPVQASAVRAAPAPPAPAPANVQIDGAPSWVVPRRVGYARDGSRMLTLQVDALREIQVSRQPVRPVLAVRCLSRLTEVFVVLGTSANIEAGDTNRVTVQLDDQTPSVQQWLRTDTYQELFAPDGLTLARQLVGASLMRFTFTPFGSRPVVTEFNVGGFDQHVATVARTCGWPGAAGTSARKR
jgi:Type VI secretion system VasI, EvfG, VC_A0118